MDMTALLMVVMMFLPQILGAFGLGGSSTSGGGTVNNYEAAGPADVEVARLNAQAAASNAEAKKQENKWITSLLTVGTFTAGGAAIGSMAGGHAALGAGIGLLAGGITALVQSFF